MLANIEGCLLIVMILLGVCLLEIWVCMSPILEGAHHNLGCLLILMIFLGVCLLELRLCVHASPSVVGVWG